MCKSSLNRKKILQGRVCVLPPSFTKTYCVIGALLETNYVTNIFLCTYYNTENKHRNQVKLNFELMSFNQLISLYIKYLV